MLITYILAALVLLVIGALLWGLAYVFVSIWGRQEEFICLTLFFCKTPEYKKFEPCLTFSQFLSFYNLNPKKWSLYIDRVESIYSNCFFDFTTYGDRYKYRVWKRARDNKAYKERALKNLNEKIEKLAEGVRTDIEKVNAEAEAKAREANEMYEEIRKRCE